LQAPGERLHMTTNSRNFVLARRGAGELAATPFWERGTQKA